MWFLLSPRTSCFSQKKAKEKAKDKAEFDCWCKKILADSAHLTEGVKDPLAQPPEFRNYEFTGPLRPAVVTPQVQVPPHITKPDYADTSVGLSSPTSFLPPAPFLSCLWFTVGWTVAKNLLFRPLRPIVWAPRDALSCG